MTQSKYPWRMLASIYVTQYIGVAFILSAAVAILRQQEVALDKLALLNLAVLPMMGKVLYAPFIDKYRLVLKGKYRSWLITSQTLMTLLLFFAGTLDIVQNFSLTLTVLAFYALSMSVQDVAVDGLSCKLFPADKRKLASSIQFSGNLLGNIIGGGLILIFYEDLGWSGSLFLLAALTAMSALQIIFFQEPEDALQSPELSAMNNSLFSDFKAFIKQHKRWFIVMALYPIASTCGFATPKPAARR